MKIILLEGNVTITN